MQPKLASGELAIAIRKVQPAREYALSLGFTMQLCGGDFVRSRERERACACEWWAGHKILIMAQKRSIVRNSKLGSAFA